jgi:hypothetical protein
MEQRRWRSRAAADADAVVLTETESVCHRPSRVCVKPRPAKIFVWRERLKAVTTSLLQFLCSNGAEAGPLPPAAARPGSCLCLSFQPPAAVHRFWLVTMGMIVS